MPEQRVNDLLEQRVTKDSIPAMTPLSEIQRKSNAPQRNAELKKRRSLRFKDLESFKSVQPTVKVRSTHYVPSVPSKRVSVKLVERRKKRRRKPAKRLPNLIGLDEDSSSSVR